jgi:hypothetical protein
MCSVTDCGLPVRARQLCSLHYEEGRRVRLKTVTCASADCDDAVWRRSFCRACYRTHALLRPHCTLPNCVAPLFYRNKCRRHYREQFVVCDCGNRKIYSVGTCRACYKTGRRSVRSLQQCLNCEKKVYVENLCVHCFKETFVRRASCRLCAAPALHLGFCMQHLRNDISMSQR